MSKIPDVENELSLRSSEMKIPLQYDNVDWGKKKKLVNRKVSHIARGGDHTLYGSKAILTKEDAKPTFIQHLIHESDDLTTLPQQVIGEIRSNIKKGAKDLEQNWKNALELVNKAYQVANVRRPDPSQKGAWKQYEQMIQFGVQSLAQSRGLNGAWRTSQLLVRENENDPLVLVKKDPGGETTFWSGINWMADKEHAEPIRMSKVKDLATKWKTHVKTFPAPEPVAEALSAEQGIGKRRFFVEIPGEAAQEVEGDDMDDIIEAIANKIRSSREVTGTKVRIEERTKVHAVLSIWVHGVKRERIVVKQVS